MKWYKKIGMAGLAALTMGLSGCSEFKPHTVNENCEYRLKKQTEEFEKAYTQKNLDFENQLDEYRTKFEKIKKESDDLTNKINKLCEKKLNRFYIVCDEIIQKRIKKCRSSTD